MPTMLTEEKTENKRGGRNMEHKHVMVVFVCAVVHLPLLVVPYVPKPDTFFLPSIIRSHISRIILK